jgi:sugar phosphate permease
VGVGEQNISPRTKRFRTTAVTLLVIAGCVNYFDRAAVAVGNPEIRAELGLSYSEMGLLLSAFAWSYGLAQIPAGSLIDRFGPRRVLGFGMIVWSVAQLAAGVVSSLHQFVAARIALGFGESPMYIGGARVCADWFPLKQRALPIGIFNASSALAPALAPPLLTLLMVLYGWRIMFVVAGLAGFAVAILWAIFYRAPADAEIPEADIDNIRRDDGEPSHHAGLTQVAWLLKFPTSWGMFLGFFGVVYISWFYATWLPGYLESARHLSVANAGLWASIPLGAGFLGGLAGGLISDRLGRSGTDAVTACRLPIIWGLVVAGGSTIVAAYVVNISVAVSLMAVGLFAANVSSSCGWALAAVIAPPNAVATLEAVQNVGGSIGGALAPLVTGILVQATGSFVPAFAVAGVIAFASAIAYWGLTEKKISGASDPE